TFAAGPAERQGRVDRILDPDQRIENHRSAIVEINRVVVHARVGAAVGIESIDAIRAGALVALGLALERPGLALSDLGVLGQGELDHNGFLSLDQIPRRAINTPEPSARCTEPRWSSCRRAPGGNRTQLCRTSSLARPACASSSPCRRARGSLRV